MFWWRHSPARRRTWPSGEIADGLSAEYGPVPLGLVVEYLQALKTIGVVE